ANARLPGSQPSGWFANPTDRMQNRVRAAFGSLFGALVFGLFASGALIVRLKWPSSKEERDKLTAAGHRLGTIEIPVSDHEFIPISMTVGPVALFAPYAAAGGAVFDLLTSREKEQQKLNAEAEKAGVPAGKVRPINAADLLSVAGAAAANVVMGGK